MGDLGQQPTAVVTGSSKGIGRAIALDLARRGYDLVVHGKTDSAELAQTLAMVQELTRCRSVTADLADIDQLRHLVEKVFSESGKVSVWVNNAGADILTTYLASASFEEKLSALWSVDVRATLLLSREVAQRMVDRYAEGSSQQQPEGSSVVGCVVNMGWDQAWSGMEGESGQLFAATKGSVMAMTASLAKSFAPFVRFNCVAPGWIKTAWGATTSSKWQRRAEGESLLGRWGEPSDVASVVGCLVDPQMNFVNGQVIEINGGASR